MYWTTKYILNSSAMLLRRELRIYNHVNQTEDSLKIHERVAVFCEVFTSTYETEIMYVSLKIHKLVTITRNVWVNKTIN